MKNDDQKEDPFSFNSSQWFLYHFTPFVLFYIVGMVFLRMINSAQPQNGIANVQIKCWTVHFPVVWQQSMGNARCRDAARAPQILAIVKTRLDRELPHSDRH